ncbi:S9 family peptidase [Chitinophaga qingshengii]|uniref:S9 family peptidase n=1 Tax=Chitinophaga qingshengii TaxID=1569794 RepID=A0ABR7TX64_9BACT|nr:prolyl oligopeptidase family serine peptidase [Chitinophaga qingshengii]MBC9934213.1 S9 family peptidase [Chitinophaga qingshengii]
MKKHLALFFILLPLTVHAQKRTLDTSDFNKWSMAINPKISNNGKYATFYIYNQPPGQATQVIQALEQPWKKELIAFQQISFSADSKLAFCKLMNNSLRLLTLGTSTEEIIPEVKKHSTFLQGDSEWLAFLKTDSTLELRNLSSGAIRSYPNVIDYINSGNGRFLFLKCKTDSNTYLIKNIDLSGQTTLNIYAGDEPFNLVTDAKGNQCIFITLNKEQTRTLWYYHREQTSQAIVASPHLQLNEGMTFSNFDRFSADGTFIFCTLTEKKPATTAANPARLQLHTFLDPKLSNNPDPLRCQAIWYLRNNTLLQIQDKDESPFYMAAFYPGAYNPDGTWQLLDKTIAHRGEWNWNEKALPARILVNLTTGTKETITAPGDRNSGSYVLSPNGKWIIYYDAAQQSYFSYQTATRTRKNITAGIPATWTTYDNDDIPFAPYLNFPPGGFSDDETILYLYDQYDIFQIDLTGKTAPINLTGGYGKDHHIVFRFAFPPGSRPGQPILLNAFNRDTKEDGFFEVRQSKPESLRQLSMQPAAITGPEESKYFMRTPPVKARDADVYLVQKMDAASAPNIYVTRDFIRFDAISDIHPERRVNWFTTELINFQTADGKAAQGILYKPENFDPRKKYPVIFYYYEKISECLHLYIRPEPSMGPMNIPYFVSNGFLVFTPDIHFDIGYPGRSSLRTVMGAANKLVQLPYVDSTRMGLQGHSFGGFQTNYIITHTNRFAAACSAAGFTDFVSAYGAIIGSGYSRQGQYELYRDRIGASLWERPDLYLENSPVLNIDKVQTPLLLMHNMEDRDVPVGQGIEFFTGLRRMGKVVYFLQYEGQGHSIFDQAALDFSTRMLEFFNYYLKRGPLPDWMTDKQATILHAEGIKKK